jgi:antitoxin MazE
MQTKVQKWGNSLGVRIPRAFAAQARIRAGSEVDISLERDGLRVKPVRQRYRLRELLRKIDARNRHGEVATGGPTGKEAW